MGDLVIRDFGTVFVGRVHQMGHNVQAASLAIGAALVYAVYVDLGNGALGVIALPVPG